jgi:hypothetical protein
VNMKIKILRERFEFKAKCLKLSCRIIIMVNLISTYNWTQVLPTGDSRVVTYVFAVEHINKLIQTET